MNRHDVPDREVINLTTGDITDLKVKSYGILKELVKNEGIFASQNKGWSGPYHSWFGRDGAISADFILSALNHGGDRGLAEVAYEAIVNYSLWQGKKNDIQTGEEEGKIPHEVRASFDEVNKVQHAAGTNELPWYIDPADGILKNWDSVDATSLWVRAVITGSELLSKPIDENTKDHLKSALLWIMRTTEKFDGLVGFIGAGLQEGRIYSGLHNQGWKDTHHIYQEPDGSLSPHPIKEVLANAEAWSALLLAAPYFEEQADFYERIISVARRIKQIFNSTDRGFILPSGEGLAQAIDGDGRQLAQHSIDEAVVLWANVRGEHIFKSEEYVPIVVNRALSGDMFSPNKGIRNYSLDTRFTVGVKYHDSHHTYWPFMSGLAAKGFRDFGYIEESDKIILSYLRAIHILGSNIEMFVDSPTGGVAPWKHPHVGQESSREQAWTAAAVYYGSNVLLRR